MYRLCSHYRVNWTTLYSTACMCMLSCFLKSGNCCVFGCTWKCEFQLALTYNWLAWNFAPCYFDDDIEKSKCIMIRMVLLLLLGLILTGCAARATATNEPVTPTVELIATFAPLLPTETPVPTTTATVAPTPDLSPIGLPNEPTGTVAYDFVDQMCAAQWYTRGQSLPCPGDASQANDGYVMSFDGE